VESTGLIRGMKQHMIATFEIEQIPAGTYSLSAHCMGMYSSSVTFSIISPSQCSPSKTERTVVDGFAFNDEVEMLMMRLRTLGEVVDWFILVEAQEVG